MSRQVAQLEGQLGVRLFERSTRRLRLTDIGQRLLVHADRARRELAAATEEMRSARDRPGGTLRVTAPELLGEEFVSLVIAAFLERYPDVRVEALFTTESVDLIARRFDLGVRAGPLADSSLIARPLGHAALVCCAAREYLEAAPPLRAPADLAAHATLSYGRDTPSVEVAWSLGQETVRHEPRLSSTSARAVCDAAARGLGVARLPYLACAQRIEAGALVEVLTPWRDAAPVHAVYASRSATNPTLYAFLEVLQDAAERSNWLSP